MAIPIKTARYGWNPQRPDFRDHLFLQAPDELGATPATVDLRPEDSPIYDQGTLGSCTGNGIAAAVQFLRRQEGFGPDFTPSRLFIYWFERYLEGTMDQDSGAMIRDGFKVIATYGVCPEEMWSYDVSKVLVEPSQDAISAAKSDLAIRYQTVVQAAANLEHAVWTKKLVVFGFTVYDGFESDQVAQTGVVPMPSPDEHVLGGHCVCIAGYDRNRQTFLCRNSWGPSWGMAGYFTMPYAYVTDPNLASDFWIVQRTTDPAAPQA